MNTQIKKIADLENVLGKVLARNFLRYLTGKRQGRQALRKVPYSVSFKEAKGSMYLGDYDTLTCYVVKLDTGQIEREHYCGSFDTALNHPEQGASFDAVPKGYALFFVTVHGGGDRLSWCLDIVTKDLIKQIG